MPNIEIIGLPESRRVVIAQIRETISKLFVNEKFYGEMVVTHVCSNTWDMSGASQPFLRVWSTDNVEAEYIQNVLRMTGFQVERPVKLVRFTDKPMWTAGEILEDLTLMKQGSRPSMSLAPAQIDEAIQAIRKHDYAFAACAYKEAAYYLETSLDGWHPNDDELSKKPGSATAFCVGEEGAKLRLIMVKQIINSLVPPK